MKLKYMKSIQNKSSLFFVTKNKQRLVLHTKTPQHQYPKILEISEIHFVKTSVTLETLVSQYPKHTHRWTSSRFVKQISTCIYISYSSLYLDHFSHSICSLVLSLIILMNKRRKQVDH